MLQPLFEIALFGLAVLAVPLRSIGRTHVAFKDPGPRHDAHECHHVPSHRPVGISSGICKDVAVNERACGPPNAEGAQALIINGSSHSI